MCKRFRYLSLDTPEFKTERAGLSWDAKGLFDDVLVALFDAGGALPADELAHRIGCHG